ncbi:hypothetical protein GHT06_022622 [Daphnia sinensis]|uniref:Uncharacterized protein n=1 Tax=Daphnia sinensis TaxID=1820382 RepID=A0AAD5KYZ9_9CRUS|nr:hypothetical protein GHT06_022622 [Daphnia sinensis]
MALNIKVNLPDQSCNADCVLHSMPCKINHDGAANITGFFSPYVENKDTDFINNADAVLEASFRGYPLQGKKITIPNDFKGIVIGEMKKPLTDMEPRNLYIKKNFGEITYWNWDCFPNKNDSINQSVEWLPLSKLIHNTD